MACTTVWAGIKSWCDAAMQGGQGCWISEVNYWGRTGIVKHKPIELLAFDINLVTCKTCIKRYKAKQTPTNRGGCQAVVKV